MVRDVAWTHKVLPCSQVEREQNRGPGIAVQMVSVAQRLQKAHVPIEEFPQSIPNLTVKIARFR
jgi:hypothetical protein